MTATVDELRDWLAVDDGWHYEAGVEGDPVWCKLTDLESWNPSRSDYPSGSQYDHPFPPTRDGAAAAIPKGWDWWKVTAEWAAQAAHTPMIRTPDTGDEIADRYRLAVLCRLAEREAAK